MTESHIFPAEIHKSEYIQYTVYSMCICECTIHTHRTWLGGMTMYFNLNFNTCVFTQYIDIQIQSI